MDVPGFLPCPRLLVLIANVWRSFGQPTFVQICSMCVNCAQVKPLWGRLSRSLSTYRNKIRAIKAKAWPHCLHGVASVHLADDHYAHLRTGAMQGLGEHSAGTSPIIHMSLVEHPTLDPQFMALWATVSNFRRCPPSDEGFHFAMQQLHAPRDTYIPRPGPHSILLVRLHQVAWSWAGGTVFLDQSQMPCDVQHSCVQEVYSRLVTAWQHRAQAIGAERKTMQGLSLMNPALTVGGMSRHAPEEQALLRTALNGTFFTADRQRHHEGTDNPDGLCTHCGSVDSPIHRHLECPHFGPSRTMSRDQLQQIASLPLCVGSHGWMPEPPSLQRFRQACIQVQDHLRPFELTPKIPDHILAFTDGACECPAQPLCRWAAWSVVISDLATDKLHPVASGLLPGWIQTTIRAEIMAALKACHLALELNRTLSLWVDNDLVYRRMCQFQQAPVQIHPNQKDGDLWQELHFAVRTLGPQLQGVYKVVSHQCLESATDEFEHWVFRGNAAADAAASAVFADSATYPLWCQLVSDIQDVLKLRDHLHPMLIKIGKQATRALTNNHQQDRATRAPRVSAEDIHEVQFAPILADDLDARHQFDGIQVLLHWLLTLCHDQAQVRYVNTKHTPRVLSITTAPSSGKLRPAEVEHQTSLVDPTGFPS